MAWAAALIVLLGLDATSRRSALVAGSSPAPVSRMAVVARPGLLIEPWAY